MRHQLSPMGKCDSSDNLVIELSPKQLARIDYKSYKGGKSGSIDELPVGKGKTSAKSRRVNKSDTYVIVDDIKLVFEFEKATNVCSGMKLCKDAYNPSIVTLALVKKLWNDIKSGNIKMFYNCVTGNVEL